MELKDFIPVIQAIIIGILALIGIVVTQSWTTKREYAKRRLDLAQEVLALFYEAADAIRFMRSPGMWAGDCSTRQRRENESSELTKSLDAAYTIVERYNARQEVFKQLNVKRHLFKATFRDESHRPFEEIDDVIRRLFIARDILGDFYWPKRSQLPPLGHNPMLSTDEQVKAFVKGMQEQEVVFSSGIHEPDPIEPVVADAIKRVEAIADMASQEYIAGFYGWWQRYNPTFRTSDPSFLRISILSSGKTVWMGCGNGRTSAGRKRGALDPRHARLPNLTLRYVRLGRGPPHHNASLGSFPSFPSRQVPPRCPSPRPKNFQNSSTRRPRRKCPRCKPQKVSPRQTHAHFAATS